MEKESVYKPSVEERVAALESLVEELRTKLSQVEASVDRNSLESIKYVRYERPKTYVPPTQQVPFFSDGLGSK